MVKRDLVRVALKRMTRFSEFFSTHFIYIFLASALMHALMRARASVASRHSCTPSRARYWQRARLWSSVNVKTRDWGARAPEDKSTKKGVEEK